MKLLIFVAGLSFLFGQSPYNTPKEALTDYLLRNDEISASFIEEEKKLINCIQQDNHALCEWKSNNYLCYESSNNQGSCMRKDWSCIAWSADLPSGWGKP